MSKPKKIRKKEIHRQVSGIFVAVAVAAVVSNSYDMSIDMADYLRKQIFPAALFNDTHMHTQLRWLECRKLTEKVCL